MVLGVVDPEKEEIDKAESDIEKHLKDLEEQSRPKRDSAIDESLLDIIQANKK